MFRCFQLHEFFERCPLEVNENGEQQQQQHKMYGIFTISISILAAQLTVTVVSCQCSWCVLKEEVNIIFCIIYRCVCVCKYIFFYCRLIAVITVHLVDEEKR